MPIFFLIVTVNCLYNITTTYMDLDGNNNKCIKTEESKKCSANAYNGRIYYIAYDPISNVLHGPGQIWSV